ncbi:hypothetical protein GRJ2_000871300 [Grus japonensis]|uniref:Uncharacterized protein n=1 Tax=Grus japonensis TaxID=30415 RepID=A0ABC9WEY0_GRUJA
MTTYKVQLRLHQNADLEVGLIPWDSSKQVFEKTKAFSPEVQGYELAFHPPSWPQDPELQHLMVTAAKAAFDLHVLSELLLAVEYEVQQSTTPHWLLYQLEEKVIINALQESPGLLMSCCVVPPADIRMVEVPHEDKGP